MENTEELNISLEEIQKLNKETRIKVLEKHPKILLLYLIYS